MKTVYLDFETTGVNVKTDRIVQICIIADTNEGLLEITTIVDPGVEISPEATKTHGITNEEASKYGLFPSVAQEVFEIIDGADYIVGYNSNRFDVPLLVNELERAGIDWDWKKSALVDVKNLYAYVRPRTLIDAYKDLVSSEGFEGAHDAKADVIATKDILAAMLDKGIPNRDAEMVNTLEGFVGLSNFGNKIADLDGKFAYDDDGDLIFTFGKHRGKKAKKELGFLRWMLDKDFSNDTLNVVRSFFVKREN